MANKDILPASLKVNCVSLNVKNIQSVSKFYETAGLDILKKGKDSLVLGQGENEVIRLVESKLPTAPQNGAGLYHVAIVHESQHELAKSIKDLFEAYETNFTGPADHLVSEAFYFQDPEGNGLELYYDRPKSEWRWENGKVIMATDYLDPLSYIKKHANGKGSNEKHVGHIHLKVGDIKMAKEFYVGALGFDVTADSWPGALFISKDGYHHHIGLNIWHSRGAGKRQEELGLQGFEFTPSMAHFKEILKNLNQKNVKYDKKKEGVTVLDPWNNSITIKG